MRHSEADSGTGWAGLVLNVSGRLWHQEEILMHLTEALQQFLMVQEALIFLKRHTNNIGVIKDDLNSFVSNCFKCKHELVFGDL